MKRCCGFWGRSITVFLIVACSQSVAYSQVLIALVFGDKLQSETLTFGLMFGPTYSTISGLQSADIKSSFNLGLYFDIRLAPNFFLHPEAIPKLSLGAEGLPPYLTGIDSIDTFFANGSVERNIKTISVPLLCRYRIKGLLFAEAGPQIDWMLKVKDTYATDVNGDDVTYTVQLPEEQFKRFAFAFAGGLHYKLKKDKGMGLGVRYVYGLTDIMTQLNDKQTNQSLLIHLMVPVGVGKSQDKN